MQISDNDWSIFVTRPISLALMLLIVMSLAVPILRYAWARRHSPQAP
jgi:putative tricarboxylic transport membrane protein